MVLNATRVRTRHGGVTDAAAWHRCSSKSAHLLAGLLRQELQDHECLLIVPPPDNIQHPPRLVGGTHVTRVSAARPQARREPRRGRLERLHSRADPQPLLWPVAYRATHLEGGALLGAEKGLGLRCNGCLWQTEQRGGVVKDGPRHRNPTPCGGRLLRHGLASAKATQPFYVRALTRTSAAASAAAATTTEHRAARRGAARAALHRSSAGAACRLLRDREPKAAVRLAMARST